MLKALLKDSLSEDVLMDFIIILDSRTHPFPTTRFNGYMNTDFFFFWCIKHSTSDPCKLVFIIPTKVQLIWEDEFPAPRMRITLWKLKFVLQIFFSSSTQHLFFSPSFCSQSSISLNCIWDYRSSYHSLKRLVCPALYILAVLSNPPLVWTLVSLHFPH